MDLNSIKQRFNTQLIQSIMSDNTLFSSSGDFSLGDAQQEYQKVKDMPPDQIDQSLKDALLKLTTDGNYETFSGGTDQKITKEELNEALDAVKTTTDATDLTLLGGNSPPAGEASPLPSGSSPSEGGGSPLPSEGGPGNGGGIPPLNSSPEKEAALGTALSNGDMDKVQSLIKDGVDVRAVDPTTHKSMLELAALTGNNLEVKMLINNIPKDQQADFINQKIPTDGNRTALHCAALNGDKDTVNTLVQAGADLKSKDDTGATPYDVALKDGNNKNGQKPYVLHLLHETQVVDAPGWAKNVGVFAACGSDVTSVGGGGEGHSQYLIRGMDQGMSFRDAFDSVHLPMQVPVRSSNAAQDGFVKGKSGKVLIVTGDGLGPDNQGVKDYAAAIKRNYGLDAEIISEASPNKVQEALKNMGQQKGQQAMVCVFGEGCHGEGNHNSVAMGKGDGDQWLNQQQLQQWVNQYVAPNYDNVNVLVSACFSGGFVSPDATDPVPMPMT